MYKIPTKVVVKLNNHKSETYIDLSLAHCKPPLDKKLAGDIEETNIVTSPANSQTRVGVHSHSPIETTV